MADDTCANKKMYFLVQWEDRFLSVITSKDIDSPAKLPGDYYEGELITAKFQGKIYNAVISEINDDIKHLRKSTKLPPKYSYHLVKEQKSREMILPSVNLSASPVTVIKAVHKPGSDVLSPHSETNIGRSGVLSPHSETSKDPKNLEDILEQDTQSTSKDSKNFEDRPDTQSTSKDSQNFEDRSELKEDIRSLRRKIRRLEDRVLQLEKGNVESSSTEEERLLKSVDHLSDPQIILTTLSRNLFTDDELICSSRTGKKTNKCVGPPRPAINQNKLQQLERVVMKKTGISRDAFIKKFENLQKTLRQKTKLN